VGGGDRRLAGHCHKYTKGANMVLMTPYIAYGGKSRLIPYLLPLLPPHQRYVETCAGGAALLIAKKPSRIEVLNDKNRLVYTFWRVLRDPGTREQLREALYHTPYSELEYLDCQRTWRAGDGLSEVERIRRWYVATQQSFTHEETRDSAWRGEFKDRSEALAWVNRVDRLEKVSARLRKVTLTCNDCLDLIPAWDDKETLFFIDPPYGEETRSETGNYEHEMSPDEHARLLDLANSTRAQVIITGYSSPLYEASLRTWQRYEVTRSSEIHNNAQGETGTRTEVIWCKFHAAQPSLFSFNSTVHPDVLMS